MSDDYEQIEVTSAAELRNWLNANHDTAPGIWLVTWKSRAAPERHLGYEEIVREALCFGWIDSKGRGLDAERTQLLLTPRKPRSNWSRPNKLRVAELIKAGRMQPAGLAVVEAAKKSGTWTALDDVENLIEPDDLHAALNSRPTARRHWDGFPRSTRRAILEWIGAAKRTETRQKRITETVELAAENIRANQWPPEGR
jgi:uncharacterized protein YdeI (YjbR/CyaY-like superfamily)